NPDRVCYVAGSMGPTYRSLSISTDVENPAHRDTTFEALSQGYAEQASGLLDGGADIILLETIFDSLNAKAALFAIEAEFKKRGRKGVIMLSATPSDGSGRILSGQMIEALYTSLSHIEIISIGLNCAFGARDMLPHLDRLSSIADCYVSAHPNAGLPNSLGGYDETPEMFGEDIKDYLKAGLLNIVGGCCGTTPEHIKVLREITRGVAPRKLQHHPKVTTLSGLEPLEITPEKNLIYIGERCNVAGSAKFARLIREGDYNQALSIARSQVESGAQVIDICMDAALIEGEEAMSHFLRLIGSEPEIARVPLMIDSSVWSVIEAGLRSCQGKSIVNSISLKEGEEEFLRRAMVIRSLGAAAVVMLFDEDGQASTFERKKQISQRAYNLLIENGFPAEDIIFDPNILTVATGIEEHDSYGKAFLDAISWIKANLPGAKVTGGVSNLSFAFRGNNTLRESMHAIFLYHAAQRGMDMAIVNSQMLKLYEEVTPELRELIEDLLLNCSPGASQRLIDYAANMHQDSSTAKVDNSLSWREESLLERITYAMTKGQSDYIESDTLEAFKECGSPIGVINNFLMPAMGRVGTLFGEGKMFLPQVIKSARVMKGAVDVLTPYIEAQSSDEAQSSGEIVIATVRGDVHDIGKNIVSVVLSCNGYKVDDLGVMVDTELIINRAIETAANAINMSGLITPSLDEMIKVVKECERRGVTTPIIIGGATTSPMHTAVKIAPHYSGVVIHAHNASDNPKIMAQLLGEDSHTYISSIKEQQQALRDSFELAAQRRKLISLEEARERGRGNISVERVEPLHTGKLVFPSVDIADVEQFIDWNYFFAAWGLKGKYPAILEDVTYGEEARRVLKDAQDALKMIKESESITLQGVIAIFQARRDGDNIVVTSSRGEQVSLPMLRNQSQDGENRSLVDFICDGGDHIAMYALSGGVGIEEIQQRFDDEGDKYNSMMIKLICDRLTEALTEWAHSFIRREMWGFESEPLSVEDILGEKYRGVRVAFGYPATPDHSLKRDIFSLLGVERTTALSLNENYMITPAESACGLILANGDYFNVGIIDQEQLSDYAKARNFTIEEVKRLLPKSF
ncbi:MAG: methionine synthase, partial [Rikenellaceae bacterium]